MLVQAVAHPHQSTKAFGKNFPIPSILSIADSITVVHPCQTWGYTCLEAQNFISYPQHGNVRFGLVKYTG